MGDLDLRVSDREREAVAEKLREHAAEGRLDPDELEERLTAAYAARTRRDLVALTRDLPDRPPAPPRPPSVPRRVAPMAVRLILFDLFCVAIWLLSGTNGSFWPAWVILVSALAIGSRWAHELAGPSSAADTSHRARDRGIRRGRDRRW
jgi:uncharacterized membrane protein YccC